MPRLKFGAFLAPHHPIGEHPMLQFAAGERTKRIRLATGVVSLPYHHPFNVAQRMPARPAR